MTIILIIVLHPNLTITGQIAGVASGGYSGAEVVGDIVTLVTGQVLTPAQILGENSPKYVRLYNCMYLYNSILFH